MTDQPATRFEGALEGDESILARAARLRFPTFRAEDGARRRVELLEEHIWATAVARGDLAELRLAAETALHQAMSEWNALEGWEQYKRRASDKTKDAEFAARARMRPDLAVTIRAAQFTVKRCAEEIDRMNRDYESASRAFTLMGGG